MDKRIYKLLTFINDSGEEHNVYSSSTVKEDEIRVLIKEYEDIGYQFASLHFLTKEEFYTFKLRHHIKLHNEAIRDTITYAKKYLYEEMGPQTFFEDIKLASEDIDLAKTMIWGTLREADRDGELISDEDRKRAEKILGNN